MVNNSNNKILALLFVGVLIGALDISIVGPAIPAIEHSIKADKTLLSWIFSIYVLANLVGISLMSSLSDINGRRKIYIIELLIIATGFILLSYVIDSRLEFYLGGVFLGLGFSVLSGSSLRYIMLNEVSVSERASTQGLITIFVSMGQITVAAAIGTLLASNNSAANGYRQVFWLIAVCGIILTLTAIFLKSRKNELLSISNTLN